MTETAPHDVGVEAQVTAHNARLTAGFANALSNAAPHISTEDVQALALFVTTSAQGLWSMSRIVSEAQPLRRLVQTLMDLLRARTCYE